MQTSQDFAVLGASSKLFAVFLTYPYQVCTGTLCRLSFTTCSKLSSWSLGSKHDTMTQLWVKPGVQFDNTEWLSCLFVFSWSVMFANILIQKVFHEMSSICSPLWLCLHTNCLVHIAGHPISSSGTLCLLADSHYCRWLGNTETLATI
jgi:hypothetical protein